MNERIKEIELRLSEINDEIDGADAARMKELEDETNSLLEERKSIEEQAKAKTELRNKVASGAVATRTVLPPLRDEAVNAEERAAKEFAKTNRMSISTEQARSVLVSGGTLATPTEVSGINDIKDAKYSSIIDLVKVVNCEGMSTNRVAYISADAAEAATQTEGSSATAKEPTFGYVDISPTSVAVTAQISKQSKKQTPLNYKAKVTEHALVSLRKKAASIVTAQLKASTLNASVDATLDSNNKGKIDEKTLRNLVLAYGGDEGIGAGMLFLNKTDLIAFGDVRGTNEKKAIYKITPDTKNPNMGTIEEGGLIVTYCIASGLTACSGTARAASSGSDKPTMFYGDPHALELDLFSDYEIKVSEDFAFDSLMDTIRGDVELGADVVVKNGFVALVIKKASA